MFHSNIYDLSLSKDFIKDWTISSAIMVTGMVQLGISFLYIPISGVGHDDIHDLMALSIIYLMVDAVMSIGIGDHCVGNEVLGELCNHMRLSYCY